MIKKFFGFIGTDSDGFQYMHKMWPSRVPYKKTSYGENGFPMEGEWKSKKHYKKEVKLYKFLLGKNCIKQTWMDEPIPANLIIETKE